MYEGSKDTALLIIDVQTELFQKKTPIFQSNQLLEKLNSLAERARQAGVPVIYVQHSSNAFLINGSEGWQLHPQLKSLEGELIIHKRHPSSFEDTDLKDKLEAQGIKKLVIAGLVTHGCVKATSLDALKRGYMVTLVSDAHSSFSKDAPKLIKEWNGKIGKAGATLQSTQEVAF